MFGSVVDLILIILIIMFGLNGYRQGFVVGALSFVGFFGCALVGLQIAPAIVTHLDDPSMRILVSLAVVFGAALAGQTIAAWAGSRLRLAIASPNGRRADDVGGVIVSVTALLLVAWMVAAPLGSSSVPAVARSVRNSAILAVVNKAMPDKAKVLYDGLQKTIAQGDFPNVFGDLTPTRARQVPEPDPALAKSAAVKAVRASVVKVLGSAPSCKRRIEGSGFVFAPKHVMTNAHVVAGTRGAVTIEVNGTSVSGQVVHYDPKRDLAVIYAPDLKAPVLSWAKGQAASGSDSIVIGYPLDGPFTATPARVRDVRRATGSDIYDQATVVRQVYTLRAEVRNGNSGGPLIDSGGRLLGVIFAAAIDDPETGFALTATEARPVADATANRTQPVSTGECVKFTTGTK